uniref:Uncharacterized protein n=1 Tax=Anguilla anguilla TaxID=7936 RepID=A0A0E9QYA1_ANGAN
MYTQSCSYIKIVARFDGQKAILK